MVQVRRKINVSYLAKYYKIIAIHLQNVLTRSTRENTSKLDEDLQFKAQISCNQSSIIP